MVFMEWYLNFLYSGPLNDLERIIVAATEQGNNPHYLAVAQILKAYYFSLMVDLWGDIPYFTAFKGDQGDKTPGYDDQAAIYADLIQLCDDAVANIALTSPVRVLGDVIYNNGGTSVSAATQMSRWRKAAKSLKFVYYSKPAKLTLLLRLKFKHLSPKMI